jgi:polyisoprenoid-binding protein YceI
MALNRIPGAPSGDFAARSRAGAKPPSQTRGVFKGVTKRAGVPFDRDRSAPRARLFVLALAIAACCPFERAEARSFWTVDPAHTHIIFLIDAVGWPRTQGQFTKFQGKIALDFNNPRASSVSFNVAADSVDAGSSSFNDFLRGESFFNAANYPRISFVSTRVEKADARLAHVTGNLTLLGVTRPISLNVEVDRKLAGAGQRVGFKASGTIDRRDFGMNSGYPVISETVHLIVTTEVAGEP